MRELYFQHPETFSVSDAAIKVHSGVPLANQHAPAELSDPQRRTAASAAPMVPKESAHRNLCPGCKHTVMKALQDHIL